MLYLPENMLFTRSFSMSVVITVCLDICSVIFLEYHCNERSRETSDSG